ncbi:MAG: paraslipin [Bacteroidetes bacterium SW_8_64_56]|jgi:regulator of protease activity HflC (stomatin/prohibitin superfamily)|nr:MAG: paraslipin [Bacteroidetes bacterium SW_7_64_58]PSR04709.1 MAG: paraslipin [Bacteroidetes bacterium SW_8_64_56]
MWTALLLILAVALFVVYNTFIIVEMREKVIVERFGEYHDTLDPGFHFVIPFVDRVAYRHETREQVLDVPHQKCITKDNIEVEVDGIVYLKVMDAYKASYGINDYRLAAVNLAQTTMRSEVGKITLDDTFSERDAMNEAIVEELDEASDPWGVKVLRYELKDIQPSQDIVLTMEQQMEAERDKRAEITKSSGDRDAQINTSEGEREASILMSEGRRQQRINEAEGEARETELLAEATANGIERVADAVAQPGGSLAVKMRLTEQFIDRLGEVVDDANVSVLPMEAANLKSFFEGASEVTGSVRNA